MRRRDRPTATRGHVTWACHASDCRTISSTRMGVPDGWWVVSRRLDVARRGFTVRLAACTINCLDLALGEALDRLEREETAGDTSLLMEVTE